MPNIHHSQHKKAGKLGVTLTEDGERVIAFWPKRALNIYGVSAADAIEQVKAAQEIFASWPDATLAHRDDKRMVLIDLNDDDNHWVEGTPFEALHNILTGHANFYPAPGEVGGSVPDEPEVERSVPDEPEVERSESGVALDGGVAYSEGTPSADCPFHSDDEEDENYAKFVAWNDAWDAAADAATEEETGKGGGSVVSSKFRAKYAEAGHPTHCGDWLAETLNELCANKEGTNLELFEAICSLNGVDTSKYKRTGVGWQGRLRMTGRNLMARRVFEAGGKLVLMETLHGGALQAPDDWMAAQKFKRTKSDAPAS